MFNFRQQKKRKMPFIVSGPAGCLFVYAVYCGRCSRHRSGCTAHIQPLVCSLTENAFEIHSDKSPERWEVFLFALHLNACNRAALAERGRTKDTVHSQDKKKNIWPSNPKEIIQSLQKPLLIRGIHKDEMSSFLPSHQQSREPLNPQFRVILQLLEMHESHF